jgi:hypothetical protein
MPTSTNRSHHSYWDNANAGEQYNEEPTIIQQALLV